MRDFKRGSTKSFDQNWIKRKETNNVYWTFSKPKNQMQLAFSEHFKLFKEIIKTKNKIKTLEIGCGRGSLSAFFSNEGNECHLIDLSEKIIEKAKFLFESNKLKGTFKVGDAENLPYDDDSFDLIFSIGLLEHFDNFDKIISESYRVLKNGGFAIHYIVPDHNPIVQKEFNWINSLLKLNISSDLNIKKENVFRTSKMSSDYIDSFKKNNFKAIKSTGVYPLPMISTSIDFPFTLLDEKSEEIIVEYFNNVLNKRDELKISRWECDEDYGQSFIVWGQK